MSKRFTSIDGFIFTSMVLAGAENLQKHADHVNALNVFPVPDGDTGTNMSLTAQLGVAELQRKPTLHIGEVADLLSKGLLMGARGNSGVILSQLFRGFAKSIASHKQINVMQFAAGLQEGVDTAYKAVVKPVEGTILTVAKEAAKHAVTYARTYGSIEELLEHVLLAAKETLDRTPDMLPILKQVGVVDAGGQGLIYIYEGFMHVLNGKVDDLMLETKVSPNDKLVLTTATKPITESSKKAQAKLATEDITYPYDMEFFIHLQGDHLFDETAFRQQLEQYGDSIIVIPDGRLVKVHIHAKSPGDVLNLALPFGELSKIAILNMRDQHRELLADRDAADEQSFAVNAGTLSYGKAYGVLAVAAGQGLSRIFSSLGANYVLSGGQTMNPSTEDIVKSVRQIDAKTVFILPNNSNIIMAARQAKELVEQEIVVIPTKTVPQGMAALLAFREEVDVEQNTTAMTTAIEQVRSGQITYAVRDTDLDGLAIKQGDYIGIHENQIVTTSSNMVTACKQLVDDMLQHDAEILTILTGEDAIADQTEQFVSMIEQDYPEIDVEVRAGGQPLYAYLFSAE